MGADTDEHDIRELERRRARGKDPRRESYKPTDRPQVVRTRRADPFPDDDPVPERDDRGRRLVRATEPARPSARPSVAPAQRRPSGMMPREKVMTKVIQIPCSEGQYDMWVEAAQNLNMPLSSYARARLLGLTDEELADSRVLKALLG